MPEGTAIQTAPESSPPAAPRRRRIVGAATRFIETRADLIWRSSPLLAPACGLLAGIGLDAQCPISRAACVAGLAVATLLLMVPRRTAVRPAGPDSAPAVLLRLLSVVLAAGSAGAFMHHLRAGVVPAGSVERYAGSQDRLARLRGVVASPPQTLLRAEFAFSAWSYDSPRTSFLLDVGAIEAEEAPEPHAASPPGTSGRAWIGVTGRVRVAVGEALLDLREGDRVELFGWLRGLRSPTNPGEYDWAEHWRRQSVVAALHAEVREAIILLGRGERSWSARGAAWLRDQARGLLTDDLSAAGGEPLGLLEAMVIGHRSQLDRRLNEAFIRSGCMHFLAVSGTNVAVLMSFVWLVGRALRQTKRRCTWLMMLVAVIYAVVAEPRPPILRATVMGVLFCLSLLLRRSTSHLNWMSAAVIVLMLVDPRTAFDAGFQLSFAAVCGVAYLSPALVHAARTGGRALERVVLDRPFAAQDRALSRMAAARDASWRAATHRGAARLARLLGLALAVAAGAWLAGTPVTLWFFQRLQPWGWLNSVMVFPLMQAVMILGLVKIALSAITPGAAALAASILAGLDRLVRAAVELFAAAPAASVHLRAPPWWFVVLYYGFFALFIARFYPRPATEERYPGVRREPHGIESRALSVACLLLGLAVALATVPAFTNQRPSGKLVVHALAVGGGTATVLELPAGGTVVYDAGTNRPHDVGRSTIVPFLRHLGVSRIDRLYVSHADMDHFSGVPTLLEELPVDAVVFNARFAAHSPPKSPGRHLLDLLARRGQHCETLDGEVRRWTLGGAEFELLWPDDGAGPAVSHNDASTVLRVSFAGRSVLLTGDIEDSAQRALLARGDLHADVLMLPHHGSVRPSSGDFLRAVGAGILVRSSHERLEDTLTGLQEIAGATPLYNTADVGAVRIELTAQGTAVSSVIPPPW
ncbi:MAG: ComEC/Rec2 family competence protein [Planctomycetes bacterium]|nr:ComEC/Rec2 family competence protein [Planctomycetota bacterium]